MFKRKNDNAYADIKMASPALMISHIWQQGPYDDPVELVINDIYGNRFQGFLQNIDREEQLLLLTNEPADRRDLSVSIVKTDAIASFSLMRAEKFIGVLTGRSISPAKDLPADETLDLDAYIAQLEKSFEKEFEYRLNFEVALGDAPTKMDVHHSTLILDIVRNTISGVLEDELGREWMLNIDSFRLVNIAGKALSLKKSKSPLVLGFDFKQKIPHKMPQIIEEKLDSLL